MLDDILGGLRSLVQGRGGGTPDEKRRLIRLKCRYKVTLTTEKRGFTGTVTDMGVQGMRLQVTEKVKPGSHLHVTFPAHSDSFKVDTVRCLVAWCRKSRSGALEAGVRYDDEKNNLEKSWVKFILRELGFDEKSIFQRRKTLRAVAMLPATVSRVGQSPLSGRILNLGVGGALLQSDDRLQSGQDLTLDIGPAEGLPLLSVPGHIVSDRYETESRTWFHGVRFRSMDDSRLQQLTRYIVSLLKQ